jgi:alpha-glucosidase
VPTGPTDVTKAVPEIDLPELLRHAKEKGVRLRLWMHWRALAPQLDEALALYEKWGVEGIMVDFMDRDDQEMVNWYYEVAEKAARHKLTVTWHGAYKPTGMERTWPNVLTYEAAYNQEYNKWDPKGTPPEHNIDIALVRMLAGPVDYHQGGMRNVLPADFRPQDASPRVQGTRGHQLAMYIVYQNHLPMMVDYPSAYRGQPELPFLVAIPTTWDETRVLEARFGDCIALARRNKDDWYIGAMTADKPRELAIALDFLDERRYEAEVWRDDLAAGPTKMERTRSVVTANEKLRVPIPPSGGAAIKIALQSDFH